MGKKSEVISPSLRQVPEVAFFALSDEVNVLKMIGEGLKQEVEGGPDNSSPSSACAHVPEVVPLGLLLGYDARKRFIPDFNHAFCID